MPTCNRISLSVAGLLVLSGVGAAHAQDGSRCDQAKLKTAAQYAKCLLKAEAALAVGGSEAAIADCDRRLDEKWAAVEGRGGDSCADGIALADLQATLRQCTLAAARGVEREYEAVFGIDDPVVLGALQFDVLYEDAPGEFPGAGAQVNCVAIDEQWPSAFNDVEDTKTLRIGLVASGGLPAGPAPLATCRFVSNSWRELEEADFRIVVRSASDTGLSDVEPFPDLSIHSITRVLP